MKSIGKGWDFMLSTEEFGTLHVLYDLVSESDKGNIESCVAYWMTQMTVVKNHLETYSLFQVNPAKGHSIKDLMTILNGFAMVSTTRDYLHGLNCCKLLADHSSSFYRPYIHYNAAALIAVLVLDLNTKELVKGVELKPLIDNDLVINAMNVALDAYTFGLSLETRTKIKNSLL